MVNFFVDVRPGGVGTIVRRFFFVNRADQMFGAMLYTRTLPRFDNL